jgi:hypothetical protein
MRRRKLLVVLVGLAVAVTAGVVVVWPPPSRITRENFDRIVRGMSRAEVEAVLGPPEDDRTGRGENVMPDGRAMRDPDPYDLFAPWQALSTFSIAGGGQRACWSSDSLFIEVYADATGQLRNAYAVDRRKTQGAFDNLLWRIQRLWRRWFP